MHSVAQRIKNAPGRLATTLTASCSHWRLKSMLRTSLFADSSCSTRHARRSHMVVCDKPERCSQDVAEKVKRHLSDLQEYPHHTVHFPNSTRDSPLVLGRVATSESSGPYQPFGHCGFALESSPSGARPTCSTWLPAVHDTSRYRACATRPCSTS
jgi:hypothetical protein